MTATADVTLVVPAVPDSIAVIRQTVSGICEALGADARTVGDIKLAATEACTNVVLHAYAGREPGSIELDAYATEDELRLLVRDRGAGMTPAPMAEGLGLGLPLIAALTSTLTIIEPDEGGTEVSMTFALRDTNPRPVSDGEYRATIACGLLLPRVLDRLLGALAARGDLSVDRLNDLSLVGDAVTSAAADTVADGHLEVIATPGQGALALSLGPFVPGGAARVRRAGGLPGGGDLFSSVASEVTVETDGDAERLTLRIGR